MARSVVKQIVAGYERGDSNETLEALLPDTPKHVAALKACLRALNAQANFTFHVGDNPAELKVNARGFATSYALAAHVSELLQEVAK